MAVTRRHQPLHSLPTKPIAGSACEPVRERACRPALTASRSLFRQGKDLDITEPVTIDRRVDRGLDPFFVRARICAPGSGLRFVASLPESRSLFRQGKDLDLVMFGFAVERAVAKSRSLFRQGKDLDRSWAVDFGGNAGI